MKSFLFALALLPQFAFAGTVVLTLSSDQLSNLKVPGEIIFESSNIFCEERGLTPQPWSAPRKQKVAPKVVSLSGNTVELEITTVPKKQDICKYRFSEYRVWSNDGHYFISIDAADDSNRGLKDAADLELTTNLNSIYRVECGKKSEWQNHCATLKDGVKKGYSSGNGANLTVDLKNLDKQGEIRPVIEFKKK